jgi:hypothetical protein
MVEDRPKNPEKARRDERLAAALRENLRRRKAQARERERSAEEHKREPEPGRDR